LPPAPQTRLKPAPIHLWAPDVCDGSGGIQALSRKYVKALRQTFPGRPVTVLIKNDLPPADDSLWREGVTFRSVWRWPRRLRTLAYGLMGLWYGLREKPDLILAMHLHFLPVPVLLKSLRQVRVVAVLHGIEVWRQLNLVRRSALRGADLLIAVSQFTRSEALRLHDLDEARVIVIPNTFNARRFSIGPKPPELLARHGLTARQPILLTISRLDPGEGYKGHEQILRALPDLAKRFPDIRYIIGGTGPHAGRLQALAQELGVADRVIFAGFIPNHELCAYYQLCDVFVMPSQKEGFGIVFLEAMACGKPVIGGNRDGSVDALDGGRLGVLVDPESPEEICHAVTTLISGSHPNALLSQPEALRAVAVRAFGRETYISRVGTALQPDRADPIYSPPPEAPQVKRVRVTVLTQLTSPYQVEFLNAVADRADCGLSVVYLTDTDSNRHWATPEIRHRHLILDQSADSGGEALRWLEEADLVVFNYYTHAFAVRALTRRALARQPWVFWGERPGALQLGWLGAFVRHTLLLPLHHQPQPIWGVGQFGVAGYVEEFGDQRPYVNLPYFSNLERFQSAPRSATSSNLRFLYCGALSRRKGSDLLASAFLELARKHPKARLILIGHGPLESALRTTLAPVAAQVDFLGFTPWDELPVAYQQGDVFCFPSRYDGWGLALVEAMASGLPVISTTSTGAALEFVQHGVNGWLIPPGDSTALVQAMRSALTAALAPMGQAALRAVREHSLSQGAERFVQAARSALTKDPEATATPAKTLSLN